MSERKEQEVVDATLLWMCPDCGYRNAGQAYFACFTHFVVCDECETKSVVNITKSPEDSAPH